MTRPLRIQHPGAVYHVTARGNAKQDVFTDETDYRSFILVVHEVWQRYSWLCYAYCLMPNHYHLLVETQDANLSDCMRHVNGVYTQRFNRRHDRVGHLFQGRYKAILVQRQRYLLELCRYVVLNPVRAGLVKDCGDWNWSSFRKTVGIEPKPAFLASDWVLSNFGKSMSKARRAYLDFVAAGLRSKSPWKELKGGILLGTPECQVGTCSGGPRGQTEANTSMKEVPKAQRMADRRALGRILTARANGEIRDRQVFEAHQRWGYTLREIADWLGVHYATASRAYHRCQDDLQPP